MFVPLTDIANVALGYKSLQNDFYYVNAQTIDQFGIESRYLKPIHMLATLNSSVFIQDVEVQQWLFFCRDKEADIRGTGALRYIDAMGDRAANARKQTGKRQTIRQALAAQGGGLWYAPKAQPHEHHIWIRKGIDGVFAPFLFDIPMLVDQRCNSVSPRTGFAWNELAAVLTSSLFVYSLEINGSTTMGAGVLEAPTTKLRDYPVFDISQLSAQERVELVRLASSVWSGSQPVNWADGEPPAAGPLADLDKWLLERTRSGVSVQKLYEDIREVCRGRLNLAADKVAKSRSKKSSDIGGVASAIADRMRARFQSKGYPEDFVDRSLLDLPFNISPELVKRITCYPLLGSADLSIEDTRGGQLIGGEYDLSIAESIVRAVLMGRSSFNVSSDRNAMSSATEAYLVWVDVLRAEIERSIQDSALGTGYEEVLRTSVFEALGVNPLSMSRNLPAEIVIGAVKKGR